MKRLTSCNLPCKLCNYFIFEGGEIFVIAFIFLGSISIPHLEIMKPSNFPNVTQKHISLDPIKSYVLVTDKIFW